MVQRAALRYQPRSRGGPLVGLPSFGEARLEQPDDEQDTGAVVLKQVEAARGLKDLDNARVAIARLSGFGGEATAESWEHAARWSVITPMLWEVSHFLKLYGYRAAWAEEWQSPPSLDTGPELKITLEHHNHVSMKGFTWYNVQCSIRGGVEQSGTHDLFQYDLQWPAPRTLKMLREDLHAYVKEFLGTEYTNHFRDVPFANRTGPKGTSARLAAWLAKLSELINSGQLQPSIVAHVLEFFQSPYPPGTPGAQELGRPQATAEPASLKIGANQDPNDEPSNSTAGSSRELCKKENSWGIEDEGHQQTSPRSAKPTLEGDHGHLRGCPQPPMARPVDDPNDVDGGNDEIDDEGNLGNLMNFMQETNNSRNRREGAGAEVERRL